MVASVHGAAVLVSHPATCSEKVEVGGAAVLTAVNSWPPAGVTMVHGAAVLVACSKGTSGTVLDAPAWSYGFDGHLFYVLPLGEQGTLVYDLTTEKWHQASTRGFGRVWNAAGGVGTDTLVADLNYPILWRLSPDARFDEGTREVTCVAMAGVPARDRVARRHYALRCVAAVGDVEAGAVISMRFTDDNGHSWSDSYDVALEADNYAQQINWLSLGTVRAPGRFYEITTVSGVKRLDEVDAEIEVLSTDASIKLSPNNGP